MNAKQRTWGGIGLATVMIPAFLGLLACMPVPIGDPERSRLDPDLTGMWVDLDEKALYAFEPFDKRAWLVTGIGLDVDTDAESYEELVELIQGDGQAEASEGSLSLHKVWRTRLGKHWFMTWEPKGLFDEDRGFVPEAWFVFRIDKVSADKFTLRMIDPDFDGFDEIDEIDVIEDADRVDKTRRAFEKVIKKNVDNDDMYDDEMMFIRIQPEHYDMFNDVMGDD